MAVLSPYLSIVTLNVSGLNSPIKRHRVVGYIKKTGQPFAASRRLISALKTTINSNIRERR